ncbi:MMPL family transporter [Virgibacillus dakarensis]|uniref:efflux RND transporter permease subunit n=1 Tax=Virgibacillus dakarensis TaxID=1917889 RepID=UPI000B436C8B|nr:MMPL family transporter [Virgibacillus dakarensis]MTW88248.1 MMPL family transporter [Virgibacillus dakarensis]
MNNDKNRAKNSLTKTITRMVPAIFTALVATGLGFVALYTSPVPMIQDFGKMLTIGLVISFILGVFLLIPIFFVRDHLFSNVKRKKPKQEKEIKSSKVDNVLDWITKKTVTFRWMIITFAILAAALGIWLDIDADAETDVEAFMPQDTQELKDIHQLRDIIGTTDQVSIVYEADNIVSDPVITWVDDLTETIGKEFPNVVVDTKSVTNIVKQMNGDELPSGEEFSEQIADIPEDQLKLFLNESQTKGVITVGIKHLEADDLKAFIDDLGIYIEKSNLDMIETTITGKAVLDVEMIHGLTTGRYQMTLLGMGLVFLSLLIFYRHPIKALIPLLPIIFIIGWSGLVMYYFDISYTPLTATLGALIIGIGTEFTVLVMERFYEERKKGRQRLDAIKTTNKNIGKAIFASALTTIGGFSALLASDFVILNNFGMMTLINISFALFSTIFVMPPIMIILDKFVKIKHTQ